jgi:hypothetical protein
MRFAIKSHETYIGNGGGALFVTPPCNETLETVNL